MIPARKNLSESFEQYRDRVRTPSPTDLIDDALVALGLPPDDRGLRICWRAHGIVMLTPNSDYLSVSAALESNPNSPRVAPGVYIETPWDAAGRPKLTGKDFQK